MRFYYYSWHGSGFRTQQKATRKTGYWADSKEDKSCPPHSYQINWLLGGKSRGQLFPRRWTQNKLVTGRKAKRATLSQATAQINWLLVGKAKGQLFPSRCLQKDWLPRGNPRGQVFTSGWLPERMTTGRKAKSTAIVQQTSATNTGYWAESQEAALSKIITRTTAY